MPDRPYQEECADSIIAAWRGGQNKLLASLPTGTGKSRTLKLLLKKLYRMGYKDQVFVLAHREEIIDQLAETLTFPDKRVAVERAESACDPGTADIIVASVATVGRAKEAPGNSWDYCARLAKFNRNTVRVIAPDEAHHATGDTYQHVFRYFKVLKGDPAADDPKRLLCGWTATPNRGDNVGLEAIFERLVFWRDIRTMIDDGWLAQIKSYRIDTMVDISQLRKRQGDFVIRELERAVNTSKRNEMIVDKYLEYGEGMGFFAYTVDVQHSEDLAALFRSRNIEAYAVSYKTPKKERRELINAIRERKIDGLCSCNALTEGTDVPAVAVGLMAKPTLSSLHFTQMVGRILRPFPSPEEVSGLGGLGIAPPWTKPYAILLDFVDLCGKHRLNTVPTLFGLRQDFRFDPKKNVNDELDEIDELAEKSKAIDLTRFGNLFEMRSAVEKLDLFAPPVVPELVQKLSKFAWSSSVSGGYVLQLPDRLSFLMREDTLGQWAIYKNTRGIREYIKTVPDIKLAFAMADSLVPVTSAGAVMWRAKWRNDAPTDKQIKILAKLRKDMRKKFTDFQEFVSWVKSRYTKGDVSQILDEANDRRRRI